MWSLRSKLTQIAIHLPAGFHASGGIRKLFPSGKPYSISVLNNYVMIGTGDGSGYDTGGMSAFVGADGAGRWFFGWDSEVGVSADVLNDNERAQAGFVFRFSNDGNARGWVDTSRPRGDSCNCGIDNWIVENWPDALPKGVSIDFQDATGFESLPDASGIWTSAGFGYSQFISLQGSQCACTSGGSATFPFTGFPAPPAPPPNSDAEGWTVIDDLANWFGGFL